MFKYVHFGTQGLVPSSACSAANCTFAQNVDPESLKRALDDLMASYGISVLLHCAVVAADRHDRNLTTIEVQERRGRRKIFGKSFVNYSRNGDLAFHGKASTRYGNHGHVNLGSLLTRFGGISNANPTANQWKNAIITAKAKNPVREKGHSQKSECSD